MPIVTLAKLWPKHPENCRKNNSKSDTYSAFSAATEASRDLAVIISNIKEIRRGFLACLVEWLAQNG